MGDKVEKNKEQNNSDNVLSPELADLRNLPVNVPKIQERKIVAGESVDVTKAGAGLKGEKPEDPFKSEEFLEFAKNNEKKAEEAVVSGKEFANEIFEAGKKLAEPKFFGKIANIFTGKKPKEIKLEKTPTKEEYIKRWYKEGKEKELSDAKIDAVLAKESAERQAKELEEAKKRRQWEEEEAERKVKMKAAALEREEQLRKDIKEGIFRGGEEVMLTDKKVEQLERDGLFEGFSRRVGEVEKFKNGQLNVKFGDSVRTVNINEVERTYVPPEKDK